MDTAMSEIVPNGKFEIALSLRNIRMSFTEPVANSVQLRQLGRLSCHDAVN